MLVFVPDSILDSSYVTAIIKRDKNSLPQEAQMLLGEQENAKLYNSRTILEDDTTDHITTKEVGNKYISTNYNIKHT